MLSFSTIAQDYFMKNCYLGLRLVVPNSGFSSVKVASVSVGYNSLTLFIRGLPTTIMLSKCLTLCALAVALANGQLNQNYQRTHPTTPTNELDSEERVSSFASKPSNVTYPFEVDVPLRLPSNSKTCTVELVDHVFANSYGQPFVGQYTPPHECKGPWSMVVLEIVGKSRGRQYDRFAGIWIGGAEILRSTTPEPTMAGIEWHVQKDISSVIPLLVSPQTVVMQLDNIYNSIYNATLNITATATFYQADEKNPPANVADVVIPISSLHPVNNSGWFTINSVSDVLDTQISIPINTYRAVLEVYASGHGCEEFWYSNPPDDYVTLAAGQNITLCGGGPYREVQAYIDGKLVGVTVPFPTIYTGGIIPTLWRPGSSIHAFNLPPYYIDVTPFIGNLVDGKTHNISLAIGNGGSFWLIDGNLQLWLDKHSNQTSGALTQYTFSNATLTLHESVNETSLAARFAYAGKREFAIGGWVEYSGGRIETVVSGKIKYNNGQTYLNDTNVSTWIQSTLETHDIKTKSTPKPNNAEGIQSSLYDAKPVLTTFMVKSITPTQGRVTYEQFPDGSFNLTGSVQLGLTSSTTQNTDGRTSTSHLTETQSGSGFFWESGDNTQTQSEADQETKLTYESPDGCYTRDIKVIKQKVVKDKISRECENII